MSENGGTEATERLLREHYLAQRGELRAPTDLWDRIEPRLELQPRAERRFFGLDWLRQVQPLYAGAAAALLMLVVGAATLAIVLRSGGMEVGQVMSEAQDGAALSSAAPAAAAAQPAPASDEAQAFDALPPSAGQAAAAAPAAPASTHASRTEALSEPAPAALAAEAPDNRNAAVGAVTDSGVTLVPLQTVIRDRVFVVLFYAFLAPTDLAGWELAPRRVKGSVGVAGPLVRLNVTPLLQEKNVSVGAITFALPDLEPGGLTLRMSEIVATRDGAEPRSIRGDWQVGPLPSPPSVQSEPLSVVAPSCYRQEGLAVSIQAELACGSASQEIGRKALALFRSEEEPGTRRVLVTVYTLDARSIVALVDSEGTVTLQYP